MRRRARVVIALESRARAGRRRRGHCEAVEGARELEVVNVVGVLS